MVLPLPSIFFIIPSCNAIRTCCMPCVQLFSSFSRGRKGKGKKGTALGRGKKKRVGEQMQRETKEGGDEEQIDVA